MAKNVLKSWLGGVQTPTLTSTPTPPRRPGGDYVRMRNPKTGDIRIRYLENDPYSWEGWEDWGKTTKVEIRRRAEAGLPPPTLNNAPRLPQSWIPSPKVKYPAPGRPPYENPYTWRKKKFTWW